MDPRILCAVFLFFLVSPSSKLSDVRQGIYALDTFQYELQAGLGNAEPLSGAKQYQLFADERSLVRSKVVEIKYKLQSRISTLRNNFHGLLAEIPSVSRVSLARERRQQRELRRQVVRPLVLPDLPTAGSSKPTAAFFVPTTGPSKNEVLKAKLTVVRFLIAASRPTVDQCG